MWFPFLFLVAMEFGSLIKLAGHTSRPSRRHTTPLPIPCRRRRLCRLLRLPSLTRQREVKPHIADDTALVSFVHVSPSRHSSCKHGSALDLRNGWLRLRPCISAKKASFLCARLSGLLWKSRSPPIFIREPIRFPFFVCPPARRAGENLDFVYTPSSRHSSSELDSVLDFRSSVDFYKVSLASRDDLALRCAGALSHR